MCDIPFCNEDPKTTDDDMERVICGSDQFQCQSGECIFSGYVCDGEQDCSNGADEEPLAICDDYQNDFFHRAFDLLSNGNQYYIRINSDDFILRILNEANAFH